MTAIVIIWILCGVASAYIAKEKDRNPKTFFFAGLLLGVFGIIIAFAAKPGLQEDARETAPNTTEFTPKRR